MTAKEKKVYLDWNKEMTAKGDERDRQFKLMQELYEKHGGGKASCCLEHNLSYLLTSQDVDVKGRALYIYRRYFEAEAQYEAMLKLAQGFVDIK